MKIRTVVLTLMLLLLTAPSALADGGEPGDRPIIVQGGGVSAQPSDAESSILTQLVILFGHSWAI